MNPLDLLTQYWNHTTFRPLQQEIIQAVLDDKDVLALLPTGGGKSICFQIPALIRPGICIVVSPLIALMKDQVDQLTQKNIAAAVVFSGMTQHEIDLVLDNCIYGQVKFLYVSPERLQTTLLQTRVEKMKVNLLVVDEAHCISQWGYDFRPSYLAISAFRNLIPHTNIIALTATATPAVQSDIQEKLSFRHAVQFKGNFMRNNLVYVVRKTDNKDNQLLAILRRVPGAAIVYVNTRPKTNTVAKLLQQHGISATTYHAGLLPSERTKSQEAWLHNTVRVMVATHAFGMGIDKANVRMVIHLNLPPSLEQYYQETGRAGRDQQKSYAVLLFHDHDIALLQENQQQSHPSLAQLKKVYQHLANYYQVAVGSHHMTSYDFSLENFTHSYQLHSQTTYHALKTLEQEGLIQLHDVAPQPSKLRIIVDPKYLYAFQVAHAQYDLLMKAVLRLYGGMLFSNFEAISVQQIAHLLRIPPQTIEQQLKTLDRLGIVHYAPTKSMPQLTFTAPRHPAATLPLAHKKLQQRALIAQEKIATVIHYAMHSVCCRAQILLTYFGEDASKKCGQCDVCLQKNRLEVTEKDYQQYRHGALKYVQDGAKALDQIVNRMSKDPTTQQTALAAIRRMLDSGELQYDNLGRLIAR